MLSYIPTKIKNLFIMSHYKIDFIEIISKKIN